MSDALDLGKILFMMTVFFILARIGSRVFTRFGLPGLIGEILVGILIANVVINGESLLTIFDVILPTETVEASDGYQIIYFMSELGVIFLLFSIGLETRVSDLMSVGKAAMLVAILGVIIPFIFGFLFVELAYSHDIEYGLFMGAAMVATSVGITARVIKDMRLLDTRESRIIVGAAVIDDILGMVVLAIVVGMTSSGELDIANIGFITACAVVFVLAIMGLAKFVVPKVGEYVKKRNQAKIEAGKKVQPYNKLIIAIILCLALSWASIEIGLAAIIGAFLAGMLIADYAWEWEIEEKVEAITSFFLSFFFLQVGMMVNLNDIASLSAIIIVVVLILLAVASKFIGCTLGARLGDKSLDGTSRSIIGIGMVPRGEVGIIVAAYALSAIGEPFSELYAAIVLMAVATTIIAPPLLAKLFKKKYPDGYTKSEV